MTTNWDSEDVLQAYINGLAHAYDPHSDCRSAPSGAGFFHLRELLRCSGTARNHGYDCCWHDPFVVRWRPGIQIKQVMKRIVLSAWLKAIALVDVVDMGTGKVVQQIRGTKVPKSASGSTTALRT